MRLHKRGPSASELRILEARPEIDDSAETILRCWHDLESCRATNMVVGPIPWDVVIKWGHEHRLDRRARLLLADVIRYLDAKRAERERSAANLKGTRR